jgi:2-polyprenyl-3-methyl-5-hydroxy-6-metoxy-1,4-benzoquinol methylase
MKPPNVNAVLEDMLAFVAQIPASAGLDWVKDREYLRHFEVERILTMRTALIDQRFYPPERLQVLDVGYLHGLVPEFLHRFFPGSWFTVLDRPDSPIFRNPEYQAMIRSRRYLDLLPLDVGDVDQLDEKFDVIILGEIIEHLDPTFTADLFDKLRHAWRRAAF